MIPGRRQLWRNRETGELVEICWAGNDFVRVQPILFKEFKQGEFLKQWEFYDPHAPQDLNPEKH